MSLILYYEMIVSLETKIHYSLCTSFESIFFLKTLKILELKLIVVKRWIEVKSWRIMDWSLQMEKDGLKLTVGKRWIEVKQMEKYLLKLTDGKRWSTCKSIIHVLLFSTCIVFYLANWKKLMEINFTLYMLYYYFS